MTGTAGETTTGRAAGDAAGPERGQGPGRRARRVPAAGAAAPHRDRHRPRRAGPHPVRAHPRLGVPAVRRAGPDPAGRAMPRGWHLDHEPVIDPDPATDEQRALVTDRAEAQADRDALADEGLDTTELDERIGELDEQITDAGMRGNVLPARPRRHRSTRRRQDAAPLPRRPVSPRTVGKTYTAPDGKTFRPSLFVTLTCPSYGQVDQRRHASRPGRLRLHPGGAGRAALRRAVRPVHPEPPPVRRLRPPVLRRHRTATAARPARPHRHPRHHLPR